MEDDAAFGSVDDLSDLGDLLLREMRDAPSSWADGLTLDMDAPPHQSMSYGGGAPGPAPSAPCAPAGSEGGAAAATAASGRPPAGLPLQHLLDPAFFSALLHNNPGTLSGAGDAACMVPQFAQMATSRAQLAAQRALELPSGLRQQQRKHALEAQQSAVLAVVAPWQQQQQPQPQLQQQAAPGAAAPGGAPGAAASAAQQERQQALDASAAQQQQQQQQAQQAAAQHMQVAAAQQQVLMAQHQQQFLAQQAQHQQQFLAAQQQQQQQQQMQLQMQLQQGPPGGGNGGGGTAQQMSQQMPPAPFPFPMFPMLGTGGGLAMPFGMAPGQMPPLYPGQLQQLHHMQQQLAAGVAPGAYGMQPMGQPMGGPGAPLQFSGPNGGANLRPLPLRNSDGAQQVCQWRPGAACSHLHRPYVSL